MMNTRKMSGEPISDIIQELSAKHLRTFLSWAGKPVSGRVTVSALRTKALRIYLLKPELYSKKVRELSITQLEEKQKQIKGKNRHAAADSTTGAGPSTRTRNSRQASAEPEVWAITPPMDRYPRHPDVTLKPLPFHSVIAELIKPSSLTYQSKCYQLTSIFAFTLTPQQTSQIGSSQNVRTGEYGVKVLLRFCLLETTSAQDDCYPPGLCVCVNARSCEIQNTAFIPKMLGSELKRVSQPVDVTHLVKLDPFMANTIQICSTPNFNRFVAAAYLVEKKNPDHLLQSLKPRVSFYTKGMIVQKLKEDADSEIATTCLRVSLVCPLGKMRIQTPCRAVTCNHVQCFDGSLYIQMNEKKTSWICPVCDKSAHYDNLVIDEYFADVLKSDRLPPDCNEIQLLADGDWIPLPTAGVTIQRPTASASTSNANAGGPTVEMISDDDCEVIEEKFEVKKRKRIPTTTIDEIDLASSSDSGEDFNAEESSRDSVVLPLKKRKTINPILDFPSSPSVIELDSDSSPPENESSEASSPAASVSKDAEGSLSSSSENVPLSLLAQPLASSDAREQGISTETQCFSGSKKPGSFSIISTLGSSVIVNSSCNAGEGSSRCFDHLEGSSRPQLKESSSTDVPPNVSDLNELEGSSRSQPKESDDACASRMVNEFVEEFGISSRSQFKPSSPALAPADESEQSISSILPFNIDTAGLFDADLQTNLLYMRPNRQQHRAHNAGNNTASSRDPVNTSKKSVVDRSNVTSTGPKKALFFGKSPCGSPREVNTEATVSSSNLARDSNFEESSCGAQDLVMKKPAKLDLTCNETFQDGLNYPECSEIAMERNWLSRNSSFLQLAFQGEESSDSNCGAQDLTVAGQANASYYLGVSNCRPAAPDLRRNPFNRPSSSCPSLLPVTSLASALHSAMLSSRSTSDSDINSSRSSSSSPEPSSEIKFESTPAPIPVVARTWRRIQPKPQVNVQAPLPPVPNPSHPNNPFYRPEKPAILRKPICSRLLKPHKRIPPSSESEYLMSQSYRDDGTERIAAGRSFPSTSSDFCVAASEDLAARLSGGNVGIGATQSPSLLGPIPNVSFGSSYDDVMPYVVGDLCDPCDPTLPEVHQSDRWQVPYSSRFFDHAYTRPLVLPNLQPLPSGSRASQPCYGRRITPYRSTNDRQEGAAVTSSNELDSGSPAYYYSDQSPYY